MSHKCAERHFVGLGLDYPVFTVEKQLAQEFVDVLNRVLGLVVGHGAFVRDCVVFSHMGIAFGNVRFELHAHNAVGVVHICKFKPEVRLHLTYLIGHGLSV